jgi:serine/threonine protein kinase
MLVPGPGGAAPDTTAGCLVKILDIGLGRVVFDEEATEGGPQLTTDGALLGTPDYMAPEQARNAHAADIRSDLYSVGCVLYHALSGQAPFADRQMVRVMIRHATEKAAPLKKFNPAVPDGLQQVVDTLMAKDPAQRYSTPDQAAKALKPFLGSTQVLRPSEADEKMQAYLQWLALNGGVPDEAPPPAPAPPQYLQPPAAPSPPAYMQPPAAPSPPAYMQPPVMQPPSSPVPPPQSPYGYQPEPAGVPDVELVPAETSQEGFTFSSRDWVLIALGAGILALLGVVIWLILKLI